MYSTYDASAHANKSQGKNLQLGFALYSSTMEFKTFIVANYGWPLDYHVLAANCLEAWPTINSQASKLFATNWWQLRRQAEYLTL